MRNSKLIKLLIKKDKVVSLLLIIEFICIFILFYNIQKDFNILDVVKKTKNYEWNKEGSYSLGIALDSSFDGKVGDIVGFYKELKTYENAELVAPMLSTTGTTEWIKGDYRKDIYTPFSANSSTEVVKEDGSMHLNLPIRVCSNDYLKNIGMEIDKVGKDNERYVILGEKFKKIIR